MKAMNGETRKLAWGGGLVVAAAVVALLAIGCGQQETKATAETEPPAAGIAVTTPPAANASANGSATLEEGRSTNPIAAGDSLLAPDVEATVEGDVTTPGEVVVITARGSSDVTSMVLTDGLGAKYPFAFDGAANLYRVSYRVPIKTTGARVGLSITATNGGNRWKRVWVFVKTTEEAEDGC